MKSRIEELESQLQTSENQCSQLQSQIKEVGLKGHFVLNV